VLAFGYAILYTGYTPEANMNNSFIVIDGKTYKSVNEMPPDVRAKYEQAINALKDENRNKIPNSFENMNILGDKNNNGVPDIFESATTNVTSSSMKFVVNGQEFNSLDDLPPDARAKYEQAMGKLDKNRNSIPDVLEGMMGMTGGIQTPIQQSPQAMTNMPSASYAPQPASPTIAPDTSNGWMLALAGVVILGLCVLGTIGIWFFFIR